VKIIKVNHLGVAPKNIDTAKQFFGEHLKLPLEGSETVSEQKVRVHFFNAEKTRVELLEPTAPDSPVQKYLSERGGGIQHVAFEVDNVLEWIEHLVSQGVQMIDTVPKIGAHNTKIAFVHPRSTGGVLVELVEESKS
jgi:methylmalonyl-CoA/ethylmalonyl-CoA epimerase